MLKISNIKLFSISDLTIDGLISFPALFNLAYVLGIIITLIIVVFTTKNAIEKSKSFSVGRKTLVYTVLLLCISIIHCSKESVFIYFNF